MTLRHAHNGIALRERPVTFSTLSAAEAALQAGVMVGIALVGADVVVARSTGDATRLQAAGYVVVFMAEGNVTARA